MILADLTTFQMICLFGTLTIVLPGVIYLCVRAGMKAQNEEKYAYLKKIKGDINGYEKEKK